jgi:hypothetical protein
MKINKNISFKSFLSELGFVGFVGFQYERIKKKIDPILPLSELGFVGFQYERIKKKIDPILQSFNPINPNSDSFTVFFTSLPMTILMSTNIQH